jgi:uncharacterized protein involved in outer membrane biogenesis
MNRMRKWQKRSLIGVSLLVLILLIGAVTAYRLTDSAHLKAIAHDKALQQLSRELTIGDIGLKLFPYPRLHASKVTLANPDWARDAHLVEAADVTVDFAFLPLLRGEVEVSGMHFEGVQINLEIADDGKRSWDFPHNQNSSNFAQTLTALSAKHSSVRLRTAKAEPAVWQLQELRADGARGLRKVAFDLQLARNNHLLKMDGKLDDLSAIGQPGAVSNGVIHASAGQASATISGQIPLDLALQNYAITASFEAASMQELFAFLKLDRRSPAAMKGSVDLHAVDKKTDIKNLRLQLGQLNLSGDGSWDRSGSRPHFNANLLADRVDMTQTFLDAGQPPLPPKKPGKLFRDKALAWHLLVDLDGIDGKVDAKIAALKLRSGIEVKDASAKMTFNNDRMTVHAFSGQMLGGSASGDAVFEGRKKALQLNLQMKATSLEQWFKQSGKKVAMSGGIMNVDARVVGAGNSLNDLAAAMSGPVNIRVGAMKILSPKAGQAEFWLTGLFSAKESDRVDLACISARLPFESGVAQGEAIAGARSDVSQLLTRGTVDLRDQTVDLHGRVRARSGINLGISNFASEVKIAGPLTKPELKLDEAGAVGAIARIGAAILTGGVSILATSIWDGANPESDPCQVVFSSKATAAAAKKKRAQDN